MELNKLLKTMMAGAMALSLAACSSSEPSKPAEDDKDTPAASTDGEVSVFYYTYSDAYISTVRAALDADLEKAGLAYTDYDSNNSQTDQNNQIETAISKGSKLLIVNLVDSGSEDAASEILSKAKSADIPVIFFNRAVSTADDGGEAVITQNDNAVFVGTDYEMAGKMQGDMVGDYLVENFDKADLNGDGVISYVVFKGDEANAEAIARTKYGVENADAKLTDAGKKALEFYDSANDKKYLVDQQGAWSEAAAADYMQTILSQYNPENNNMVEVIIANNDGMALGAISALQNAGYNTADAEVTVPVFGVDAIDAAKEKISEGSMVGTIKQDAEGMAATICTIAQNLLNGKDKFDSVDVENVVGTWRVNIPYAIYTGE